MKSSINPSRRIQELDQQMIKAVLMDALGALILGLGVYAKIAGQKNTLLPFMSEGSNALGAIVIGALLMFFGMRKIISTIRQKHSLSKPTQP